MASWRRRLVVGLMVAALAAVPGPALGQAHDDDGMLPPGDWSDAQKQAMHDLIARTERDLPAFGDPAALEAMGFIDFGVTAPGGYDHYINWDWMDDEHLLDPTHPESLVFQRTWNPDTQELESTLVSAMFFLPSDVTRDTIPTDLAWWPGWHTHENICVTDQGTFGGFTSNGECSNGRPFDKPPMMHVWIVENECGHRFGGIDIGGVHCDVHGQPGGSDPGHGGPGHGGDPSDGGHGDDGGHQPDPPPATPVVQQPTFTG